MSLGQLCPAPSSVRRLDGSDRALERAALAKEVLAVDRRDRATGRIARPLRRTGRARTGIGELERAGRGRSGEGPTAHDLDVGFPLADRKGADEVPGTSPASRPGRPWPRREVGCDEVPGTSTLLLRFDVEVDVEDAAEPGQAVEIDVQVGG